MTIVCFSYVFLSFPLPFSFDVNRARPTFGNPSGVSLPPSPAHAGSSRARSSWRRSSDRVHVDRAVRFDNNLRGHHGRERFTLSSLLLLFSVVVSSSFVCGHSGGARENVRRSPTEKRKPFPPLTFFVRPRF